jgi:DNA-binding NarL/FixJ family response regulator
MDDIITLIIVDDHARFRKAVMQALKPDPMIRVIGQGVSGGDAIRLTFELQPNILLLDLNMPEGGLVPARTISARFPATRIIIFSSSQNEDQIQEAIQAGVKAYILKGVSGAELIQLIHGVWDREIIASPHLVYALQS